MIIYRIFNKINSKSYIGQSINCFNERYTGGKWWNLTHNDILLNSINKYGLESFDYEILEEDIRSLDRLNELEIHYAEKYNSYRPFGYNIRGCGNNKYVDDEMKIHLSKFRKGTNYIPKNKKSSKFKGVGWRMSRKSWRVVIDNNQLKKSRECDTEMEAAELYDKVSLYLYGKSAFINFEERREEFLSLDLKSFYNDFLSPKKRKKYPTKDDSELLDKIKPLIWKIPISEISRKLNVTIRKISWCVKKHKLQSPGKNYWQRINVC